MRLPVNRSPEYLGNTMKVLIVHAHPEPKSFTAALRDQAVETLQAQGHEVRVSDLYAMNWNPVASAGDLLRRQAFLRPRRSARQESIGHGDLGRA